MQKVQTVLPQMSKARPRAHDQSAKTLFLNRFLLLEQLRCTFSLVEQPLLDHDGDKVKVCLKASNDSWRTEAKKRSYGTFCTESTPMVDQARYRATAGGLMWGFRGIVLIAPYGSRRSSKPFGALGVNRLRLRVFLRNPERSISLLRIL